MNAGLSEVRVGHDLGHALARQRLRHISLGDVLLEPRKDLLEQFLGVAEQRRVGNAAGIKCIERHARAFVIELMTPAAKRQPGRTAAIVALEETCDQRLAREAQATVQQWAALDTEYDRVGRAYQWDKQRKPGTQLGCSATPLMAGPVASSENVTEDRAAVAEGRSGSIGWRRHSTWTHRNRIEEMGPVAGQEAGWAA